MNFIFSLWSWVYTIAFLRTCAFRLPEPKAPTPQCLTDNAKRVSYCGRNVMKYVLQETPELREKKLITVSPGGFKGFYMLGVTAYIKAHYELSPKDYIFSGSSAGAWNALVLSYKGDGAQLFKKIYAIIRDINRDFKRGSIHTMQKKMRNLILENFRDDEFALNNIFIGVTHLDCFMPRTTIYTGFESLRDAVDCCIASSHVPFITGGAVARYRGLNAFDGGFSKYPYLNLVSPVLEITPSIWSTASLPSPPSPAKGGATRHDCKLLKIPRIEEFTTLFSKHIYDLVELFELGFLETFENGANLEARILSAHRGPLQ